MIQLFHVFKEYPGEDIVPLPPDWRVPHEWVTARLMWRHLKYAVLVVFIVAALLTPSPMAGASI